MSFDHYKKTVGTANAVSTILSTHCRTQTIGPTISKQPAEACLNFWFFVRCFVHRLSTKAQKITKRYEKRKIVITWKSEQCQGLSRFFGILRKADCRFQFLSPAPWKKPDLSTKSGFFQLSVPLARNVKQGYALWSALTRVKSAFGTICGTLNFTCRKAANFTTT